MNRAFTQHWLEILCKLLPKVNSAIFMIPDSNKNLMRPLARYPATLEQFTDFSDIVKLAVKKHTKLCIPNAQSINDQQYDFFAYPIFLKKVLLGVIVIKIKHLPEKYQKSIYRSLMQSVQWLNLGNINQDQGSHFYSRVVGVLAASFEQQSYHEVLIQMVTELTRNFQCERVAFAEFEKYHSTVVALSNSAEFDNRSNLIQKIADAMDEAIEQDSIIIYPEQGKGKLIQRAHRELSRKFGSGSILTIPLTHQQEIIGAVSLLRSEQQPFNQETQDLCQQTLSLMSPFLALKKQHEKSLLRKIAGSIKQRLGQLFGLKFLQFKLFAILAILLITATSLIESDFRVTADAILEGKIQRVVTAPVSGYLFSASVRAGDTVTQGDELASLNDSELKLELTKLNGNLQKLRREYREAQSIRDLVKVRVISEQLKQSSAEIELTQTQLENIHLTAPFDGVIIEGDLTQALGSPVERGDTLFKIAPLEGYRIILKVDESEISYIKPGQSGTLVLSSLAGQKLLLTVEKITAVAKADNGANIFRVEASLDKPPELLRPGMQGIGKINAGRARLVWIWTHEITDRLRLWFWSWMP